MADWLVVVGALVAGFAFGALALVLLAPRLGRAPAKAARDDDEPLDLPPLFEPRAPAPRQGPAAPGARRPLTDEGERTIPSEWARRLSGEPDAGRQRGVCSGCGTALSVSSKRPLRITCPECGRTRLLT